MRKVKATSEREEETLDIKTPVKRKSCTGKGRQPEVGTS